MKTKITNILLKTVVFLAVLGVIFLLTMYNAKLLSTLNWFKTSNILFDRIIIIASSIAYSLGSIAVVIWYNPVKNESEKNSLFVTKYIGATILKVTFVTIDGIHVYVYNNTHIQDLATYLSPVYALQTALILFFVGSIVNDIIKSNEKKQEYDNSKFIDMQTKLELRESEFKKLTTKLNDLTTEKEVLQVTLNNSKSKIETLQLELSDSNDIADKYSSELEERQNEINSYYPYYLKSEASRIRKKNENNRTNDEKEILIKFENLNA